MILVFFFSFKTHVAATICNLGGQRKICFEMLLLTARIMKWKCEGTSDEWKNLVRRTDLILLRKLPYKGPQINLISAFVER